VVEKHFSTFAVALRGDPVKQQKKLQKKLCDLCFTTRDFHTGDLVQRANDDKHLGYWVEGYIWE